MLKHFSTSIPVVRHNLCVVIVTIYTFTATNRIVWNFFFVFHSYKIVYNRRDLQLRTVAWNLKRYANFQSVNIWRILLKLHLTYMSMLVHIYVRCILLYIYHRKSSQIKLLYSKRLWKMNKRSINTPVFNNKYWSEFRENNGFSYRW